MIGSARDIVEECGVPRFVFTDFPLGNPVGKPDDVAMQSTMVRLALALVGSAVGPRTTVQAPFVWSDDEGWRDRYMQITDQAALAEEGRARRARQAAARARVP